MSVGTAEVRASDFRLGFRAYESYQQTATGVYITLPPNSPSCFALGSTRYGGASASSNHSGGVQTAFADGSVHFVSDTVHTKNMDVKGTHYGDSTDTLYPAALIAGNTSGDAVTGAAFSYGLWSELGSINGGESTALP